MKRIHEGICIPGLIWSILEYSWVSSLTRNSMRDFVSCNEYLRFQQLLEGLGLDAPEPVKSDLHISHSASLGFEVFLFQWVNHFFLAYVTLQIIRRYRRQRQRVLWFQPKSLIPLKMTQPLSSSYPKSSVRALHLAFSSDTMAYY